MQGPQIQFSADDDDDDYNEQQDEWLVCKDIPVHGKYLKKN